jgi:hypothetical protein
MKEKDLLELKTKINKAKESSLKLEGEKDGLMKQLKNDFGCKSIEEAEKKLKDLEKTNEKSKKQINKGLEKLQKDLDYEKA